MYSAASAIFAWCTRYFFQRDTSSKNNCNRNYWGQPSGWKRLIVVMCTSTRILPYTHKIDTKNYPPIPIFKLLSILDFVGLSLNAPRTQIWVREDSKFQIRRNRWMKEKAEPAVMVTVRKLINRQICLLSLFLQSVEYSLWYSITKIEQLLF